MENRLYFGDNLTVLRDHEQFPDACVDLIYLDPPFNSKRDYNLLFKSPKGHQSEAQITAFEDSWHWGEQAEREYDEILHGPNTDLAQLMTALRSFLGENDMMAYLTMMANRLLELHRVLKTTGSLYLHCDPTASHYLKVVLDAVFGKENFINEIIWRRYSRPKGSQFESRKFGTSTDTILFYGKTDQYNFFLSRIKTPLDEGEIEKRYNLSDAKGVYYSGPLLRSAAMGARPNLVYEYKGFKPGPEGWRMTKDKLVELDARGDIFFTSSGIPRRKVRPGEEPGVTIDSLWTDVEAIGAQADERLGYPTQKPLALLERIIAASSNEGDVVLDPFCGCGTAVHAAQKLKRKWLGIDITCLAIDLIEGRLKDAFGARCKFEVHGLPKDLESARELAVRDKYQFQWWAVGRVEAQPYQGKKKGADGGIDGIKFFRDVDGKDARKIIVSVKGGGLKADDVRALNHVREREGAEIGLLISLEEPTKGMIADAASAGLYESAAGKKYPRIQLLTIEGLLNKTQRAEHPDYEPDLNFKKAKAEQHDGGQGKLF